MGTQNQRLLPLLCTPYSLVPLLFDEGREFKTTWTSQGSLTITSRPNSLDLVPCKVSSSYFWENLRFTDIPWVFFLSPVCVCVCACMRAHPQLCPTLCNPMDCHPPGSSVHGISQARILEWVAISSSRGSSQPRDGTHISCTSCISRDSLQLCPGKPPFEPLVDVSSLQSQATAGFIHAIDAGHPPWEHSCPKAVPKWYPSQCQGQASLLEFPYIKATLWDTPLSHSVLSWVSWTLKCLCWAATSHCPKENPCSACACKGLQRSQMKFRVPVEELMPETCSMLFCLPHSHLFLGTQLLLWTSLSYPYKFIPAEAGHLLL